MDFLHHVEAVVILDDEGRRVFAKYYRRNIADGPDVVDIPFQTMDAQKKFESAVLQAKRSQKNMIAGAKDVLMLDGHTVIMHRGSDTTFLVVGNSEENEGVLLSVLQALVKTLQQLLQTQLISSRLLLQNYDTLLLTVDEILDNGIILDTNESSIASQVNAYSMEYVGGGDTARRALSTVNQYLRENL